MLITIVCKYVYADVAENYSPRALKNPHIASSLQQSSYIKNESSVDSNGKFIALFFLSLFKKSHFKLDRLIDWFGSIFIFNCFIFYSRI